MASSSVSAISDREVKRLEKVLVQEAKADQKSIEDAIKNVKQAEKTLHKCAKTTEKAQKQALKVKEKEHSSAKALNKAKHKHADVLEKEAKLQDKLFKKRGQETGTDHMVRQMQSSLEDCERTLEANTKDREARIADIRAQFELDTDAGSTASRL